MCMCGIVGCLALALDAEPDPSWVATATQRISHRGPDDEGLYSDNDVALGYKRLAIIDLSQAGHQPMQSADGRYWMAFNGEIYNYIELGRELLEQGVVLRSSCDSEVLLETYARVGKDVVHRLRGMYAFAIWDSWTRELFCARDQFGIKPFYYRLDQNPEPGPGGRSGGRHAAAGPDDGYGGAEALPAGEPDDWFTPGPRQGGTGRHAAGPARDAGLTGRLPRSQSAMAGLPSRPERMLRFASERKALADPGELRALDHDAL